MKLAPVSLQQIFKAYIASRQIAGKHREGGKAWQHVITQLIDFLGHDDAEKITRRNLLDWRDKLIGSGMAPKTVSDKYLVAVNAVLGWAHTEERLSKNAADKVRQDVPDNVKTRETGYTLTEAVAVLKASIDHRPRETTNRANLDSRHLTAAKRWVPLLCAFTGARIAEITQLRKEDIRQQNGRWVIRITPDAGSVNTGQYRDVPLHHQIIELGFADFVNSSHSGPLFHTAATPEKYLAGARVTAGKISAWLNELGLVPNGVQPSHGWRHRFKTQGRELDASGRVLDAIQGHAKHRSADNYGDVTLTAMLNVIDRLPHYDLR